MAKNGKINNGHLNEAIEDKTQISKKNRTQIYNPVTGNYIKRDSSSGKFIDVKSDGKAFKGIKKELQLTKIGITISKAVAKKAEKSVIKTINGKSK